MIGVIPWAAGSAAEEFVPPNGSLESDSSIDSSIDVSPSITDFDVRNRVDEGSLVLCSLPVTGKHAGCCLAEHRDDVDPLALLTAWAALAPTSNPNDGGFGDHAKMHAFEAAVVSTLFVCCKSGPRVVVTGSTHRVRRAMLLSVLTASSRLSASCCTLG